MATAKFYASENNMGYVTSSGSSWTKNSARQGAYGTNCYYGVAMFGSIGTFDFTGKTITNIRLTFDFLSAGSNASKTLYMYRTEKTSISGTGSAMRGTSIGNLTGTFYNNTRSFDFNDGTNAAIFAKLLAHFQEGGRGLCWYKNESSQGTPKWSVNYLSVSAVTMTITYEDDFVWYNKEGVWTRCAAYYRKSGDWSRCRAHYNIGGTWQK